MSPATRGFRNASAFHMFLYVHRGVGATWGLTEKEREHAKHRKRLPTSAVG